MHTSASTLMTVNGHDNQVAGPGCVALPLRGIRNAFPRQRADDASHQLIRCFQTRGEGGQRTAFFQMVSGGMERRVKDRRDVWVLLRTLSDACCQGRRLPSALSLGRSK